MYSVDYIRILARYEVKNLQTLDILACNSANKPPIKRWAFCQILTR